MTLLKLTSQTNAQTGLHIGAAFGTPEHQLFLNNLVGEFSRLGVVPGYDDPTLKVDTNLGLDDLAPLLPSAESYFQAGAQLANENTSPFAREWGVQASPAFVLEHGSPADAQAPVPQAFNHS